MPSGQEALGEDAPPQAMGEVGRMVWKDPRTWPHISALLLAPG